jgi:GH18 family chitinase
MLDIEFSTLEDGLEKLKKAVGIRDKMGGAMYWQICEDDCLRLADKLTAAGTDKQLIASIGGWGLRA